MFTTYFENSKVVIPLIGKAPILDGWQACCEKQPASEIIENWQNKFKGYNIGLPCGSANNIIALDIDSNDPEILKRCPPSPVRKAGAKGETRFFKFNPDIHSQTIGDKRESKIGWVEILSTGRQTVLPPSIHPDTKLPYQWITKDRFPEFDAEDLPELKISDLDELIEFLGQSLTQGHSVSKVSLKGKFTNDDPARECPHGSQDRLKYLSVILALQKKPVDEAVQELLNYDRTHHFPIGYFEERGRVSDQIADPQTNAEKFYINVKTSLNKARVKKGEEPLHSSIPVFESLEVVAPPEIDIETVGYPKGRGIIEAIQDYVFMKSQTDTSVLALGAALPVLGTIFANRYEGKIRSFKITPNLYVGNVSTSGGGKMEPQNFARSVLSGHKLLGPASYKSDSSIVELLNSQQERLDVIDEATTLFKMASSSRAFESSMSDILTHLFSIASTEFSGISSIKHGACAYAAYRPHVSILASTTQAGFKGSIEKDMALKGLMPRFVIFYRRASKVHKLTEDDSVTEPKLKEIQEWIDSICNTPKNIHFKDASKVPLKGYKYDTKKVLFSPQAESLWLDFQRDTFLKTQSDDDESIEDAFMARWAEIAAKFALIDALATFRETIELDSVEWGIKLIRAQWDASRELYAMATATNEVQKYALRVISVLKRIQDATPNREPVVHSRLFNRLPAEANYIKNAAIDHIVETNKIFIRLENTKTKPRKLYSVYPFKEQGQMLRLV